MAEHKKQHYVPQFYLRNFASDRGAVALYHIAGERIIDHASIRTQCYKDYFYGKSGMEGLLSDIEGLAATLLSDLRDGQVSTVKVKGNHLLLPVFISIMMRIRTSKCIFPC